MKLRIRRFQVWILTGSHWKSSTYIERRRCFFHYLHTICIQNRTKTLKWVRKWRQTNGSLASAAEPWFWFCYGRLGGRPGLFWGLLGWLRLFAFRHLLRQNLPFVPWTACTVPYQIVPKHSFLGCWKLKLINIFHFSLRNMLHFDAGSEKASRLILTLTFWLPAT